MMEFNVLNKLGITYGQWSGFWNLGNSRNWGWGRNSKRATEVFEFREKVDTSQSNLKICYSMKLIKENKNQKHQQKKKGQRKTKEYRSFKYTMKEQC